MRSQKPIPIKEVLSETIKRAAEKKEGLIYKEDIEKLWKKAAGKEASKHSSPARLKGNALIINVDSSIWIYHLNTQKAKIEERLSRLIKQKPGLRIKLRAGER